MNEVNRTIDAELQRRQMLTSIVANIFNYAISRGLAMEQIKTVTGLIKTDLIDPEARLPEELAPTIWKLLGETFPDEALGIHMASAAPLSIFGQLAHGLQYAETLRAALYTFIEYRSVLADQLQMNLIESETEVILQVSHPVDGIDGGYGIEAGIAILTRLGREVIGGQSPLVRVEFTHQPFGELQAYETFFGVPVFFQQTHNALVFDKIALEQPTQFSDRYLFQYIQRNLDLLKNHWQWHSNPSQIAKIYDAIARNAESSEYSAEALANQLNMSLRSLQTLAQKQGFTVSQLLENAREAQAWQLLIDHTLSIEAIAFRLGYSDDRAFRRAFKRWTGKTPTGFRRKLN